MAPKPEVRRSPVAALLYGAPIGFLGGLIGLGGAEFRLPVLAGVFGYAARRAVALNLAISLVTVVSALLIRGGTLSFAPLLGLVPGHRVDDCRSCVGGLRWDSAGAPRLGAPPGEGYPRVPGGDRLGAYCGGLPAPGCAGAPARCAPGPRRRRCVLRAWHRVGEQSARGRRGRAHHPHACLRLRGRHQDGRHSQPIDLVAYRGGGGAPPP